jgi:hypothetical protein
VLRYFLIFSIFFAGALTCETSDGSAPQISARGEPLNLGAVTKIMRDKPFSCPVQLNGLPANALLELHFIGHVPGFKFTPQPSKTAKVEGRRDTGYEWPTTVKKIVIDRFNPDEQGNELVFTIVLPSGQSIGPWKLDVYRSL